VTADVLVWEDSDVIPVLSLDFTIMPGVLGVIKMQISE